MEYESRGETLFHRALCFRWITRDFRLSLSISKICEKRRLIVTVKCQSRICEFSCLDIFTSSLLIVSFCSRWYERSWPFSAWKHENYTFVFTINVIIDERYCLDVDDFIRRDEWNSCWTKFELSKIFFPKKKKRKLKLNIRSKFDHQFHQKRNYPISPSWSNRNHRGWKG